MNLFRFYMSILRNLFRLALVLYIVCLATFGNAILPSFCTKANRQPIENDLIKKNPAIKEWFNQNKSSHGEMSLDLAVASLHNRRLPIDKYKSELDIRARLSRIAYEDRGFFEPIVWQHGSAVEALSGLPQEQETYLSRLENAKLDPSYWAIVCSDSIALSSDTLRTTPALRGHYVANRDWYSDMLEVLLMRIEIQENQKASSWVTLDELIEVASRGEFLLLDAMPTPKASPIEACLYFEAFREFGEAISLASKMNLPPSEIVEVLLLNRGEFLGPTGDSASPTKGHSRAVAERLCKIYREQPDVWDAARRDINVVEFNRIVPNLSQPILQKHPDLGVASLITTQYQESAAKAASIVDHYGELGISILAHYSGSERFRSLLAREDTDFRIAMVAVLRSDEGLQSVQWNPAYVQKYVNQDGSPVAKRWWSDIPIVGSLAIVANNYANGTPSDWTEIGWAAWDVADLALLVFSMGTSKVVTEASKQSIRSLARKIGTDAIEKFSAMGTRKFSRPTATTAMSRLTHFARTIAKARPIRWTVSRAIHVTDRVRTYGREVTQCVGQFLRASNALSPTCRAWIARGLLGASLSIRLPSQCEKLCTSMKNAAHQLAKNLKDSLPVSLADAFNRTKHFAQESYKELKELIVNYLPVCLLILLAVSFIGVRRTLKLLFRIPILQCKRLLAR